MKNTPNRWPSAILLLTMLSLQVSCVNNLSADDPENIEESTVPISLSTRIQSVKSRVAGNDFEANDSIGLYVTINPHSMKENRYVDNMKFTYSSSSFQPNETVFFPEGGRKCDFMAYYPYSPTKISSKSSQMNISVHSNQSSSEAYSGSHFMVATAKEVTAKEQTIDLLFKHQCSRLNISIKAEEKHTLEELLEANPSVRIKDVHTKAIYDFSTNSIEKLNSAKDVIPHGEWSADNDLLTGKSAILLPQSFAKGRVIIEVTVNNTIYEGTINQDFTLQGGYSNNLILSLLPSPNNIEVEVGSAIDDWETGESIGVGAEEVSTSINLSLLSFDKSSIYKVKNGEKQVAEICKEYLLSDEINAQAIVLYPMIEGKADLSKGIVCQIIGESENKHGGEVSWNLNQLSYKEGSSLPIDFIYIDSQHKIQFKRPQEALQLQAQQDLLTDTRENETVTYGITKIATQYWMRGNLKATRYRDGTAIPQGEDFSDGQPKLYFHRDVYAFYNAAVISHKPLSPSNWRIANQSDWHKLRTYINDDVSVLKSGAQWKEETANNLTGFNAAMTGFYADTYSNAGVQYWCTENSLPETAALSIVLLPQNKHLNEEFFNKNLGASIRCIKE